MKKILLSLGTIATVAAPAVAVVSCGGHDELPGEKSTARSLLDGRHLSTEDVEKFRHDIDGAKSIEEVSKIRHEIEAKKQDYDKKLKDKKVSVNNEIDKLLNLDSGAIKDYKDQIENEKDIEQLGSIVEKAKKVNDEIAAKELKAILQSDYNDYISDRNMKPEFYLKKDYEKGVEVMKAAKSREELRAAHINFLGKKNDPTILKATKDDFVIDQDGIKLFFSKDDTEVTWTNVSDPKQPTITYKKKNKTDNDGVPILTIWENGVETNKNAIIDKVNASDCGFVLKDFSGSYYVNGIRNIDDFGSNDDVIKFFNRSTPVLDINTKNWIDIKNMKDILNALWPKPTGKTYNHVTWNKDDSKFTFS